MYAAAFLLVAITLVELHGPTGQNIEINTAEISSLREPVDLSRDHHHWAKGIRCIIVMSNGKYIAVIEDCQTVAQKLTSHEGEKQR
jgi:hypothetical protein